ncbi:MAG TPA: ABC transporter permease [Tepidisphaeraceae bacterium]|nr:ABC transporter permease [Tepidisphaeraceae bacterium]
MNAIVRTVNLAGTALRRNVMRSALTCLGIIIGVAAVIAMMEIGHGASTAIERSIASMGANTLLVLPGTAASGGVSWGSGSVMTLTPEDCDAILRECPSVRYAAPLVRARSSQVVYGNRNWIPQQIMGTTTAYLDIRQWTDMAEGEAFTEQDVRNAGKVCLLGKTLARELFQGVSPIGKDVRIGNVAFRVVGVLKPKGANMMGSDQDDIVLAPWTTIKYRLSNQSMGGLAQVQSSSSSSGGSSSSSSAVNTLSQLYPNVSPELYPPVSEVQAADTPKPVKFANIDLIQVAPSSPSASPAAMKQIQSLLHERHHIREGEPDDFQIRDMGELMSMFSTTTTLMSGLLLGVATISLIVGGVGIMNIMLVSVTERTREIGLRMAVGARARDILRQFLIESIILCLAGGAVGILIGRGASLLLKVLLHLPTQMSVPAIVASVIVSATVGIVFGYYPAWKASRLDPIEALRYE